MKKTNLKKNKVKCNNISFSKIKINEINEKNGFLFWI